MNENVLNLRREMFICILINGGRKETTELF